MRLPIQLETDLDRYLKLFNFAVDDAAPLPNHLKPGHVTHGLRGLGDGRLHRLGETHRRRAHDFRNLKNSRHLCILLSVHCPPIPPVRYPGQFALNRLLSRRDPCHEVANALDEQPDLFFRVFRVLPMSGLVSEVKPCRDRLLIQLRVNGVTNEIGV